MGGLGGSEFCPSVRGGWNDFGAAHDPIGRPLGPFADGIDEAERRARLRTMRAIVHLTTGPRGERLAEALRLSERDTARLLDALDALAALAPIDRRHVLASFARLHRPA